MHGTQAQRRVRITSYVRSDKVGPRSSQEVDPTGQAPGQQDTQGVTLPGTYSAAMPATTQLGRLSRQLESCSKIKGEEHTSWQGSTEGAVQGHPPSSSQNASGQAEASPTAPTDEGAGTEQST